MQKGEHSRRLGKHRPRSRPRSGLKWAQAARSAQPISRPSLVPLDLAASRTIYSAPTKSHASTRSSFAAEEQKREGHHLREERVELVVSGFPNRRGDLARKTTSEF
jgi:hypothetical protein